MALKNVKYVLINENNEPIKNEDDIFDIKTAEIILENYEEINEFNASNLKNNNQQINELQTKNTELISQLEQQTLQLKQIEVIDFINSLTDNKEFKNVLLKSSDINDDIEVIKIHLQSVCDELIKVQTVNTGGVPKNENKEKNILDTDNVFNK
jgi:antitoxin component HigA of HigAB toxin-antitoxin module